jgi:hypothetical protein
MSAGVALFSLMVRFWLAWRQGPEGCQGLVGFAALELGDVFHGAGAVGTAHDVADGFDGAVQGLLGSVALTVGVVRLFGHDSVKPFR